MKAFAENARKTIDNNNNGVLQRRQPAESTVKIGIDYGKSFLKMTLTINDPASTNNRTDPFKLGGGRKTVMVAVCQAAETSMNLKQLVELVHLQEYLHYTFAGDLKVLNLVTGLECHSSLYPCPFCLSPSNV